MSPPRPVGEVGLLFAKLGLIGFGGPAAHIAMMRDEVVGRRRWIDDQEFLDLVAASYMIPGPTSTEMAIHLGYRRAGVAGLLVGGLCFIAPAVAIVLLVAWTYVRYGTTPVAGDLLWAISAVVLAIILGALWSLSRTALRDLRTGIVAVAAFVLYLLGVNELVILAAGALVVAGASSKARGAPAMVALTISSAADPALWRIGLIFLKIGSLLFGSGYVLVAFLRNDLVRNLGWLTEQQLLDAISIGQLTPGPLFTTATFIGYVLAGFAGAAVATVAIFLPSFVFVALTGRVVERVRRSRWASAALDGLNAAVVGMLAGVLVVLARAALTDVWAVAIALVAGVVVFTWKINAAWLVLAGALLGLLRALLS